MKDLLIKDSPIPLHYQVQKYIVKKIDKGAWKTDEYIPTEKQLGNLFNVSRITIRKALSVLENDGRIKKIRGKGTVVSKGGQQKQKIQIDHLLGLYRYYSDKGISVKSKIINKSIIKPDNLLMNKLNLTKDEEICKIERLRIIDGEPLNFSKIHIVKKYCPLLLEEDLENQSLHSLIEKNYGLEIAKIKTIFYSIIPESDLLDLLYVEGLEPLQVLENVSFLSKEKPIEYSINYFRTTKILFELEVSREKVFFGVKE